MLIVVAKMVFAELAGGVALDLHDIGDRWHPRRYAMRVSRHADGQQTSAKWLLAKNKGGAARRAALLAIGVRKNGPLAGDAVNVRRLVTDQTHGISTDLRNADVIAKDHEEIALTFCLSVIDLIRHCFFPIGCRVDGELTFYFDPFSRLSKGKMWVQCGELRLQLRKASRT